MDAREMLNLQYTQFNAQLERWLMGDEMRSQLLWQRHSAILEREQALPSKSLGKPREVVQMCIIRSISGVSDACA